VDWNSGDLRLLTEPRAWPETGRPGRAGISSFGVSGTNAHVVLEAAPEVPAASAGDPGTAPEVAPVSSAASAGEPLPWLISAADPAGLRAQAARIAGFLDEHPQLPAPALARALLARAGLRRRAAVVSADPAEAFRRLAEGGTPPGLISGTAAEHVRLAFLFTGQGSQRPGMACDLYAAEPAFAAAFDEVAGHLDAELDRTLHEIVADGDLDQTVHTQPALFAVEVAQFRLAGHYGVRPDYLLGHSIGEIAAAHCAGVLSLPDACTLVAARGRLMQALPATGAMVAVEAAEDEVAPLLTAGLAVAAVNGPASVVVSGAAEEA
jgi:acyl transferase domain-containing protein